MVIYLGSLVQLCCREGGKPQTSISGVCGECSQCLGHTRFAPAHGVCAFPVYTAQAPGCSARELSKAGPGLYALSRSKPLRFRFSGTLQRHRLSWACFLCPSRLSSSGDQVLGECTLPRWGSVSFHLPGPSRSVSWVHKECCLRCALCLLWEADLWLRASWWMSTIQDPRKTWLTTGSLLAPRLLVLAVAPPASLPQVGDGPVHSQLALLWYFLSPLFCEWAQQCLRLELFAGKFSLSGYPTVWVAISC